VNVAVEAAAFIDVNGVRLEIVDRGRGRPILFLHSHLGPDASAPVLSCLAEGGRVIAPSHPGFGRSPRPSGITTVDDLAYLYLDLLDELGLADTVVIGSSLGGWIAAAMAVKSTARMARLVLANPVGIKVGDRETRDIADIFAMVESDFVAHAFADPVTGTRNYAAMPDEDVTAAARNREAAAVYLWSPYMHDPKLKGRLHRIRIPTLVLWGTADRLVGEGYGRAFAAAVPGARFEPVAGAGHFPHMEQPQAFARRVLAFAAA
jgi:pimeloyl-ACP methyl ester carboxylesterase